MTRQSCEARFPSWPSAKPFQSDAQLSDFIAKSGTAALRKAKLRSGGRLRPAIPSTEEDWTKFARELLADNRPNRFRELAATLQVYYRDCCSASNGRAIGWAVHNSSSSDRSGSLDADALSRIERIERRFRRAIEATVGQDEPANLADYVSRETGAARSELLIRLISVDLEVRRRHGGDAIVEDYLDRFSELSNHAGALVSLLLAELRARKLAGEEAKVESCKPRFPQVYDRLVKALQNHENRTHDSADWLSQSQRGSASMGFQGSASQFGGAGYQLVKHIGEGSYGEVWRAEAPGGVDVAIKFVNRPLTDAGYRREHEALELVKRLRHPFLLQTHAYWSEEERLVVVTELADCSLRDRLVACQNQNMPGIPVEELCGYMRESAEALDFLRSKDILHRDIKPENILIVNGHAKVADFGIARAVTKSAETELAPTAKPTPMNATIIGTPHFMPPEVWQSSISEHLDQYSLAAAYVLLRTGKPPFAGDNLNALMFGHMTKAPELAGLLEQEKEVVLKALSKDPKQRFESCLAFVEAIEHAVGVKKTAQIPRWPFYAAGGLLALAAMLLLGNWWLHRWDYELSLPATVEIAAGDSAAVLLTIVGNPPAADATVTFDSLPEGLAVEGATVAAGQADAKVLLKSSDENQFGIRGVAKDVVVRVERNGVRRERSLQLRMTPPRFVGSEALEAVEGARFERIAPSNRVYCTAAKVRDVAKVGAEPVLFRLVTAGTDKPFYLMENKVWIGLFLRFAESEPKPAFPPELIAKWKAANARLPVFETTAVEAMRFAAWLVPNGKLPSRAQWRAAAQAGRTGELRGPFRAEWRGNQPGANERIAVNRKFAEGPMPVGMAADDVTPIGLRDMAGNGKELTRDGRRGIIESGLPQHFTIDLNSLPGEKDKVFRMGRSFTYFEPLLFQNLLEPLEGPALARDPETGFRVVYEP